MPVVLSVEETQRILSHMQARRDSRRIRTDLQKEMRSATE